MRTTGVTLFADLASFCLRACADGIGSPTCGDDHLYEPTADVSRTRARTRGSHLSPPGRTTRRGAPRPRSNSPTLPQASAPAVRGEQVRIRPLPSPPACRRVAVIGDSLMDNARWYLSSALGQAGYSFVIDAQPSRRIPESVRAPYSGVIAARQVRSTWGTRIAGSSLSDPTTSSTAAATRTPRRR